MIAPSGPDPDVLVVVANQAITDARVMRQVDALCALGMHVEVLGVAPGEEQEVEILANGARLTRVPVGKRSRDRSWRSTGTARLRCREQLVQRQARAAARRKAVERTRHSGELGRVGRLVRAGQWTVARARERYAKRRVQRFARGLRIRLATTIDRLPWLASWKRDLPSQQDLDEAFTPILAASRAPTVHAHDVDALGPCARAVRDAQDERRRLVYDAHEFVAGLTVHPPRTREALRRLEADHIRVAAEVITVSPRLADELQRRYDLARRPAVVLNAPATTAAAAASGEPDIRSDLGLPAEVVLLVYAGGLHPTRGLETVVDALPDIEPRVHLALLLNERNRTSRYLRELLEHIPVTNGERRAHVLPYVPHELVPVYLRTADIGLNPLLRTPNHDVALPNKLLEYLAAGIGVLTSDVVTAADVIQQLGAGRVFQAGAVASFRAELDRMIRWLAEGGSYQVAPDELAPFLWPAQVATLQAIYDRLRSHIGS